MAEQYQQFRHLAAEAHGLEDARGQLGLLRQAHGRQLRAQALPLGIAPGAAVDLRRAAEQTAGAPDQGAGIAQADALDQAEGGGRQTLEQAPAALARQSLLPHLSQLPVLRRVATAVADLQLRRQQARQLRAGSAGAQRRVGDGQAEETGEAAGLEFRADLFQGPAQRLGTHIDAEEQLGQRHLRRRGRRRLAEPLLQLFLPGQLIGPLPQLQGLPGG